MTVQTRLAQVAFAGQTAKGTPATAPAHVIGVTGGSVYQVELEESELDATWDNRALAAYDRTQAVPVADTSIIAMPHSIGQILRLGFGAYSVTGVGPFEHVFTVGDNLPWATLWGKYGATSAQLTDAKVDSIELEWEKTGALKGKAKFIGCGITLGTAFPTYTTEAEVPADGVFTGNGGTFTIDGAAARITGGSLKIENALEVIVPCYSVTPEHLAEARMSAEVSLKVKPDDLSIWRKIVSGTTGGTTPSAAVLYGSFALSFNGPGGALLEFEGSKVAWTTSMPDADPAGGAAELTLTGRICLPASGSPLTATLTNDVTTYAVV